MISQLKNTHPCILVVGDMMIDHYLWGSCDRISPEAPVQIVNIEREEVMLGGAGNVINNLIALGADVKAATVLGKDENAHLLIKLLREAGVDNSNIIVEEGRKTSKKNRILATSQQIVRYDYESTDAISKESEILLLKSIHREIDKIDAIIISDYAKGVLTKTLVQQIINLAKENKKKVFVDPKGSDYSKYKGAYLLTPNKKEASIATNIHIKDDNSLKQALISLKNSCSLDLSMITLSEEGIAFFDKSLHVLPTISREVYDVTGAGDTVIASLAFGLSNEALSVKEAVKFANLAAGMAVSKIGSATVTLDEIEEYEASLPKYSSDPYIKNIDEMIKIIKFFKDKKKKIVFTNGCFDILHIGHVKYLQKAKSLGDILIVGLNSDQSVKKLKGESRPVNKQYDRAYLLAALDVVDYVIIFDKETPYDLISTLKPHILVKGADYKGKEVVGSDLVDEVKLVLFIEGKSTTTTIAKIKSLKETSNHHD